MTRLPGFAMASTRSWKKRLLPGVALVLVLAAGVHRVFFSPPPLPFYQGKSLRDWSRAAAGGDLQAQAALRAMGDRAVPGLVWLLEHRDPALQRWAWEAPRSPLLPRGWGSAIRQRVKPPLAISTREDAARSLGIIGPPAQDAAPALANALHNTEGRLRWEAAEALVKIGSNCVPTLVRALRDRHEESRHGAAYVASFLGPQAANAVPALIRGLDDPSPVVRQSCAYSLSQIRAPALLALIDGARQSNTLSGKIATTTLASFDQWIDPVAPLVTLAGDPDPTRRRQAIAALGDFRPRNFAAFKAIVEALEDPAPEVRLAALKILSQVGSRAKQALPGLVEGLRDESPSVREWSARVLGNLGEAAASARTGLQRLLQDACPAVRAAATEALTRIPPGPTPPPSPTFAPSSFGSLPMAAKSNHSIECSRK